MELILLWGFCAIVSACIASGKGRSGFGWFILGAMFGPLAMIAVGLMGKVEPEPKNEEPAPVVEEDTKVCPFCAETIKKAAIVCKHCGRDLPKEEAPAAE